jgi:3' terminal RNA ribose 2'-O-methyltransferase Hen1
MIFTITNSKAPATDLGYLLHKHPDKLQSFSLPYGKAHVFYPEATEQSCTAVLLLDVDPIGLVRKMRGPKGNAHALAQYVNDRPYVASSFLSVALSRVFGSALKGTCKDKPELVDTILPLTVKISVLPCRGGEQFLKRLFEPLGYTIEAERLTLDENFPEWGESSYYTVTISGETRLADFLSHLYVLVPVLDDDKHYWVAEEEIQKLLKHGEGWLESHPEKEVIARRYLKHQRRLVRDFLARLIDDEVDTPDQSEESSAKKEHEIEKKIGLRDQRIEKVISAVKDSGASTVLDLGCGDGMLLRELLKIRRLESIVGMDVSHSALERASSRIKMDRLSEKQLKRINLIQGSLMYRDKRLHGFDAACVMEVIEHFDPPRLQAFERVLFEYAKPDTVVVTTPNVEYNATFENLPEGKLRHRDHRFEWTRAEFETWANDIAGRFGYSVTFSPIGPEDPELGAPTQMGVFQNE